MNPITVSVAELKPALAGLGKVIAKRVTLPVLGCVRIERTKAGQLELTATDLDASVVAKLETADQGEATSLLIPYDDLQNITKSCGSNDALIIAPTAKNRAGIRFPIGNEIIEHGCESLPVEEFPPVTEITGEPVPLGEVRRAIQDALACASADPSRVVLNGAYLDVSKPGAHYVVGTDGRHLFSSNSFALPLRDSLIIPSHRFLGWKEFNNDGEWTLRVLKPKKDAISQFEIASEHWRFISRCVEGNFPNWRQVVPQPDGYKTTAEIDSESVDAFVQMVARMPGHDPINQTIGIEITNRVLRLLGKSQAANSWTRVEPASVKSSGRDATIFLNRQLLIKALRFGLTRVDIIDARSPLRFSRGGRQMIVMPVRPDAATHVSSTPPPPTAATNPPPPQAEQQEERLLNQQHKGRLCHPAQRPL